MGADEPRAMGDLGNRRCQVSRATGDCLAQRFPQKVAARFQFSDPLAHRIEAAADLFLMPSRFEPCGLSQMYSLKYGTVPVVRVTGGLADTIVDTTEETLAAGTANGFTFLRADVARPVVRRSNGRWPISPGPTPGCG